MTLFTGYPSSGLRFFGRLLFFSLTESYRMKKARLSKKYEKHPLYRGMPQDVRNLREAAHKLQREKDRQEFRDRVLLGQNNQART